MPALLWLLVLVSALAQVAVSHQHRQLLQQWQQQDARRVAAAGIHPSAAGTQYVECAWAAGSAGPETIKHDRSTTDAGVA